MLPGSAVSFPPNRQIYLVHPKFPASYWGLEKWLGLTVYDAVYPPLGMLTLGALAPHDFHVTLCDENAGEKVDYNTEAQIVGITGYVNQMHKVFDHADQFRARGKTVILGGPLANLMPDQCRQHCDVLFEGEAEYTWPEFLQDYARGEWKNRYVQEDKIHLPDSPMPRLDLMKRRYAHGIVQTTRGCPFTCEFCDIIVMYGRKMRVKPIEQVMSEIQAWKEAGFSMVFFSDDNFVGNRAYSKELLRAVAQWNNQQRKPMSFYTQASIDMVRDDELLELMRAANFVAVFIGIESPRKESLAETHKTQNVKLDLVKAVHKVQSYGLFVYAGMIVGFDADDPTIFDEQFNFLQEAGIAIVMTGVLVAVPKTPLYKRLEAAGRLRNSDDPGDYGSMTNGQTNIVPLLMTMEQLARGQESLYRRLYSPKAFSERLIENVKRFRRMRYRPERFRLHFLGTLLRLVGHYWSRGWVSRKFFLNIVWKTLQHSPRSLRQSMQFMGMYKHFCEVNSEAMDWDPWAEDERPHRS